ncbi:interferon lambda-1 [Dasypus novemcinctus]|uniref:Interferon 1IB1 n=1 Tax=Dasypus novemcinctus TaxID=9361 RepID=A0A7R8C3L5_DASNO|nr:interferon lambda-1 [Dasypus novemcinctus]CAB0000532.1 TPA: interferon 1IB1 [Dasypus novemcinctus]
MAAAWVLVLVAVMLGLARAGPVPTSRPTSARKGCHIDRFKALSPRELEGFKKAKDAVEESLSLKNWSCSSRLFPRTWDLRQLQSWERPVALEAELALTLQVLEATTDSALGAVLDQPLHTLRRVRSELQACVAAGPAAGLRPQGRLRHWLRRLHEAPRKESPSCLEASVTFNLFRLLLWDLKCVAGGDLCA